MIGFTHQLKVGIGTVLPNICILNICEQFVVATSSKAKFACNFVHLAM